MRLRRTIHPADGLAATVWELTVADVRQVVHDGGELSVDAVLRDFPGAIQLQGEGWEAEFLAAVWEVFLDLNRAVFSEPKAPPSALSERHRRIKHARQASDFDDAILSLIEAGHAGIMEYPYRLYVRLCQRAEKRGRK